MLALAAGLTWRNYGRSPLDAAMTANSLSGYSLLASGDRCVVDNGGIRVVCFSEDGTFRWDTAASGTIRALAPTPDGRLYAACCEFTDDSHISAVYVECYDGDGRRETTVYRRDFIEDELLSYNNGMLAFQYADGQLYYATKQSDGVQVVSLKANGMPATPVALAFYPYENAEKMLQGVAYDVSSATLYVVDKLGALARVSPDGVMTAIEYPALESAYPSLPYALTFVGGRLWVSDIGARYVLAFEDDKVVQTVSMGADTDPSEFYSLYYWIAPFGGDAISLSGRYDVLSMNEAGEQSAAPLEYTYDWVAQLHAWTFWGSAALLALLALTLGAVLLVRAYRRMGFEKLMSSVLVTIVVAIVTTMVMIRYTDNMDVRFTNSTLDTLSGVSKLTAQLIDGDKLAQIDSPDDYTTDAYRAMGELLKPTVGSGQIDYLYGDDYEPLYADWDTGIYRNIVRVIDGRVYYVYSGADEYGSLYPLDYPYQDSEYQVTYEEDRAFSMANIVDATGEYTYTNTPIHDSTGAVVGILEMGIDQRAYREQNNALMREIALSVIIVVIVIMLLVKEFVFFGGVIGARAPRGSAVKASVDCVRPFSFLIYFTDCLALVISPLFASALYEETLGIPREFGVAIAFSATFLFVSVAALLGGRLSRKVGLYPLMIAGVLILIAGEIVSALSLSLPMFIAAKCVVGFGAGLLLNAGDTFIAMQPTPDDVERGFSNLNVAYSSGTNCALMAGAAIFAQGGYSAVYWCSALSALLLLGYIFAVFTPKNLPEVGAKESGSGSVFRFLFSPRVLGFFLFFAVPYYICNSFIYYFLPLQGVADGLSEDTVSRIVFAYGLVSIYIGPAVTSFLNRRLHARWTLLVGGVMVAAALCLYAYMPTLSMMLIAVAAFSVADSFSMPMQSVYYTELPETNRYGSGAALGVSNVVNGVAQMASSYCFAAAMLLGVARGVGFMGIAFGACLLLYLLTGIRRKTSA